jgi:uncharacterized protein YigE (DUF2233 family)
MSNVKKQNFGVCYEWRNVFNKDFSPKDPFIQNKKTLSTIGYRKTEMVLLFATQWYFYISNSNILSFVCSTKDFVDNDKIKVCHTIRAPMLVIDGQNTLVFKEGSSNLNIRMVLEYDNKVVLQCLKKEINFMILQIIKRLGCKMFIS